MALPTLMFGRRREAMPAATDPFTMLRREMDRLFDELREGPMTAFAGGGFAPAIDMRQTDKGVEVTAELPGMAEKDVEVNLAENMLTIRGEKKMEREEKGEQGARMVERSYGSFTRSIPLPIEVDEDKVTAEFKNGVLKIDLPAAPDTARKTRKIQVKSG
jgi:HSP20 family protein